MSPTLPTERDLPPVRQREIRDELIRHVDGTSSRYRVRWLAPAAVAATVIAVIGAGYVLRADDGAGPNPPATRENPAPVIPGITPERAAQIVQGCTAGAGDTNLPGKEELRLYNLVTDAAGTSALLLAPGLELHCEVDPYLASPSALKAMDWLPGPLARSGFRASAGEAPGSEHGPSHGVQEISGRVNPEVKKVRVAFEGGTVEVTPMNGTYLARLVRPVGWAIPDPLPSPVIRAYDGAGAEIPLPDLNKQCYLTPSGDVISGGSRKDCEPAVPWQY